MAIVKGDEIVVYLDGVKVTLQTDCSLSYTADMIETTNKDSAGAKSFIASDTSWTMSGSSQLDWSDTPNAADIFADISAGTQVAVDLGVITTGKVYGGNGYFTSFNIEGPRGGVGSVSYEIQGTGTLTEGTTT